MPKLCDVFELPTFTEALLERAGRSGNAVAHVEIGERAGTGARTLTYGELDREARRIASLLQERGAEGTPVLLLYGSTTDFLAAYAGCLYAGAVAVPAPLPGKGPRGRRSDRVSAVLRDTGARWVLTEAGAAPEVSRWLADSLTEGVTCLATDLPGLGDAGAWRPVRSRPDDLAFLQYTSGSVSDPRGVMVSHRNLMDNQRLLRQVLRTDAEDRFGSWLPHFHDMGFIAHLLHPLLLGSLSVQMSATSFVKRPLRWLQAIEEYGVSVGGGPNFAYDLCVERVSDEDIARLDLSRWRLALNGAEPVRASTMDAFTRRFAPAGLRVEAPYPCYGLAEATLLVSAGTPGALYTATTVDPAALDQGRFTPAATVPGGPSRTLTACGAAAGYDLRIVDPESRSELPPGVVGEVWLRGDSVAQGYWRRPAETERTFRATLDTGETGFLRTGDLGALEEGRLYITGRLKELIILNGRNVYPQDIEWTVRGTAAALGAGVGAAFSVDTGGSEQLVVVHEVRASDSDAAGLRSLLRRIQDRVGAEFNIPVGNVLLVRAGSIARTTSGKIQRTLMRTLFLQGALHADFEVLDPAVAALVCSRGAALGEDLLRPEPAGGGGLW
ncbi:fatty acyl-AMP ligase [Streptomyces sp. A1136]|uniref:fatty acyl-AMP ligase n=1 Tax=Streptomyces sp. A1136 TaxID=2563102 RepID=UPI00109E9A3E|nr:fatty acyl-AMP ligase [Streptomyces sp. A1136]THA54616.1 fatty acyl-AMP ligase [Streptomyces sp. A1136]